MIFDKLKNQISKWAEEEGASSDPSLPLEEAASLNSSLKDLQAIYNLETVDVHKVRRIGESSAAESEVGKKRETILVKEKTKPSGQLELILTADLDETFSYLLEPIEVLELSMPIQRALLEQGKKRLRDLIAIPDKDWLYFKGLGQAHVDEVKERVQNYTKEATEKGPFFSATSLLKRVLGDMERRALHIFLVPYRLEEFFPLPNADRASLRHLTPEARQRMQKEALSEARQPDRADMARRGLLALFEQKMKPWMASRGCLASLEEIEERLAVLSVDPSATERVFKLLSDVYFEGEWLFQEFLRQPLPGLFCLNAATEESVWRIVELAKSCFYRPRLTYELDALVTICAKELAVHWEITPQEFIEKVLRYAPDFRVGRDAAGKMLLTLC